MKTFTGKYGSHSILIEKRVKLLCSNYTLVVDGVNVDNKDISIGSQNMCGLIQENGIDKPIMVELGSNGLWDNVKLFINHNQIPLIERN